MNVNQKITDAEHEVLKLLWEKNKALSSGEINEALMERMGWEKSTVRTLVYRLTEKGALKQEKREVFYYTPLITEKAFIKEQTKSFLEKIYRGSAKNLIASLFEQDYVSSRDMDELKQFWNEGSDHVE